MSGVALQAYLRQAAFYFTGYLLAVPISGALAISKVKRIIKGERRPPLAIQASDASARDFVPGLHHSWLVANGIRLHTVRAGPSTSTPPKPVMVFIHGFPEAWFSWRHQLEHFKQEYDVVAFDMRGYNESDKPLGIDSYLMRLLVSDVVTIIKSVSPDRQVTLVAHDWGGVIAWVLARAHPELLSHLVVLCAPHPSNFLEKMTTAQMLKSWYIFFFQVPWIPEAVLSDDNFVFIQKMFTSRKMGLRNRDRISPEEIARYKVAASRPGALTSMINYYRALYRYDPRYPKPKKGKLKVPTLLMWAEDDGAFTPKVFEDTEAHVEDLTTIGLSDCSHWAQQDRPDLVNRHITEFLASHATTLGSRL
ncbi:hypothetical protein ACKKBG_A33145 [Auxenochlorella protothecoides x Auxenochlorella symbiontica]|uniref:AB hydrolase-1 domain-containing protein n=3 Tax=Auxenochlorella protothecoides TaxID=3075 RepID=A0A1D1ZM71_AUXPR